MANILDKHERHRFLEETDNSNNSFIANVNKLANKVEQLIELNVKLTPEQIDILTKLAGIGADTLAEDLAKGSEDGYRKLDIDLLKNFTRYDKSMTDDEKRELWANVDAQVYYDSVTVTFKDKTSIHKIFEVEGVPTVIRNHHQLYDQFNEWPEFKSKYGYTVFNIAPDTVLHNHELLRFTDGQGNGSTIDYIVLHVAPQGQNLNYDAAFQGAKEYDVKYTWVNTTSVLLTICNDLASILNIADSMEDLRRIHAYLSDLTDVAGNLPILITDSNSIYNNLSIIKNIFDNMSYVLDSAKYITELENAQTKLEEVSTQVSEDKNKTEEIANNVKNISDSIKNLQTNAITLSSEQEATAEYDPITGILTLGIPRGLRGIDGKGIDGLPPDHRWVGTALQFRNPDNTWGVAVDLKVDKTPPATKESLGQVQIGDGISVDDNGVISVHVSSIKVASKEEAGIVKIGEGINVEDGTISVTIPKVNIATKDQLGVIKIGANLTITKDGTLSADAQEIKIGSDMIKDEDNTISDKREVLFYESMPEEGLPTENVKEGAVAIIDDGDDILTLNKIADEVAKRLSTEIAALRAELEQAKNEAVVSTIIYPNGGSADNPANITTDQRYVMDNPFSGYFVQCEAQLKNDDKWGCVGQSETISTTYYIGIGAYQLLPDDKLVVQTGRNGLMNDSNKSLAPFGVVLSNTVTTAPCRIVVTRLGKIPE